MKPVFVYLRVSGKVQLDGMGLDRQRACIEEFCAKNDYSILRVFEEQESGTTEFKERDKMTELLDIAGPNTSQIIVVERVDRIARDLIIQECFFKLCAERGISVYTADTGEELVQSASDASRIMIRQIFGVVAQWERSQIIKKLQDGRRRKKLQTGKPCGGPQPYNNREVINNIMQRHREGLNPTKICRYLQNCKILSPTGKTYWTIAVVQRIIARELDLL